MKTISGKSSIAKRIQVSSQEHHRPVQVNATLPAGIINSKQIEDQEEHSNPNRYSPHKTSAIHIMDSGHSFPKFSIVDGLDGYKDTQAQVAILDAISCSLCLNTSIFLVVTGSRPVGCKSINQICDCNYFQLPISTLLPIYDPK